MCHDWMIDAPDDDPIPAELLPEANCGRLLDRAVQRHREKSGTRDSSPPGFADTYFELPIAGDNHKHAA